MQAAGLIKEHAEQIQDGLSAENGEKLSRIDRALHTARTHLGMEVAYVSRFEEGKTVFREVDAPGLEDMIKVGDEHSLDDVYCMHILEGRLPNVMKDTSQEPLAASMPITNAVPIGRHMSLPLTMSNGEVYGMFCCLGPAPDESLNERDLNMMKVFADFTAEEIEAELEAECSFNDKRDKINQVIAAGKFSPVFQPIYSLSGDFHVGFECLARFDTEPYRPPNIWFDEAGEVGLGTWLEIEAIKNSIEHLDRFPGNLYLTLNASPETIIDESFAKVFEGRPYERFVLEITEHAQVADYDKLNAAIAPLRQKGMRLAVDDAGSGYSSLQHIVRLKPDIIKLDIELTSSMDNDPVRYALGSALISFARATNCEIVAEGVETESELAVLKELCVHKAQGYYLGKPMKLDEAAAL